MSRIAIAGFTALTLLACAVPAQPYDLNAPWGMHGPTYSHMRHDPNVWERAQSTFDGFHQLGMDYARMDIWWSRIETARGEWEWDYFDRAIAAYDRNGVHLMAILGYGPSWNNGAAPVTDDDVEAWAEYVERVVTRYGDVIKEWEVWNEPNILPFWAPRPDAVDYARLLQVTYDTIKRVDPSAVVLGGGMAGPDAEFLAGIFEHGAGESFDVLTYHGYGQHPTRENMRREMELLRPILEANGRGDVPIWLSEHGIFTGPGGVDEVTQSRDIVRMFVWRRAEGVERSVYLSMRDWHASEDAAGARDFWGVMTGTGEPKPSFNAVQTMLRNVARRPYAGEVHLGDGVEAFLFGTPNDNRLVLWSDEEREFTLDAGTVHLTVESLFGESTLRTSDDRGFTLALSPNPLWLHNVGANLSLLAQTETNELTLARGETAELVIAFDNPFDEDITVQTSVAVPPGLTSGFGGVTLPGMAMPPEQSSSISLPITVAADAPVETMEIPVTLSIEGLGARDASGVHVARVTVAEPFSVAALPMPSLDEEGNLPLRFAVTNHTNSPLEFTAGVTLDEENLRMSEFTVAQREEIDFPVALDMMLARGGASVEVTFHAANHTVVLDDSMEVLGVPHASSSVGEVTVDGDLSEWAGVAPLLTPDRFTEVDFNPRLNGGIADMAITTWMAWDESALHIALRVEDDAIQLPPDQMIWDFDGLQIAFDTRNNAEPQTDFDYDDIELEIGLLRDGSIKLFPGKFPAGRIEEIVAEETEIAIGRTDGALLYEMTIPAEVLDPMPFEAGACVGFNLIHNDNDGDGREGWFELAPGIGWGKQPDLYPTAVLLPANP